MPIDNIIMDWNGTIFVPREDALLWDMASVGLIENRLGQLRVAKAAGIVGSNIIEMADSYLRGLFHLDHDRNGQPREAYPVDRINRLVRGVEPASLHEVMHDVAQDTGVRGNLNHSLLSVTYGARNINSRGVFSTGYGGWPVEMLDAAEIHPDFVHANDFVVHHGRIRRMRGIVAKDAANMNALAIDNGINQGRTVYIGDSREDQPLWDSVSYQVLAPGASEQDRLWFASRYRNGVVMHGPRAYQELTSYLRRA
jgi:hypothetical protein